MVIWDWFSPLDHIHTAFVLYQSVHVSFLLFPESSIFSTFFPILFLENSKSVAPYLVSKCHRIPNLGINVFITVRFIQVSFIVRYLLLLSLSLLIILGLTVRWIFLLAKLVFCTTHPISFVSCATMLEFCYWSRWSIPRFLNCGSQVQYLKSSVYQRLATWLLTEVFCLSSAKLRTPALKNTFSFDYGN